MFGKILITALAALMFIPGTTTAAIGRRLDSVAPFNMFSDNPVCDAAKQAFIVLAQNDKRTSEENGKTESEPATGESEAAAADDKKTSDAESKPPAPFVPSEQIAGEQAVDFPADI